MQEEIWRDVPNYEGVYQVSNLGRVKSLPRNWNCGLNTIRNHNGKLLKHGLNSDGYANVVLCKDKNRKTFKLHQLVAITFLNHIPNGNNMVVDHINDVRNDNRLENLQILTHRENSYKTQGKYSSQYKGVSFVKASKKWRVQIVINNKTKTVGRFSSELEAHIAYQNKLKEILK
jgi:hypothetical protein